MLLKWLFTLLAIIWLYQAVRQLLMPARYTHHHPPPPAPPPVHPRPEGEVSLEKKPRTDGSGEYIDYEEIK